MRLGKGEKVEGNNKRHREREKDRKEQWERENGRETTS